MMYLDRILLKARARERVLDRSFGVMSVSFVYFLLTDWISTLANLIVTSPIDAIGERFTNGLNNVMNQAVASGGTEVLDFSPVYSATISFARELLSKPSQQFILFFFLLFYFYSVVMSYGYSGYAMRVARGERLRASVLFDQLWLAGKIILMSLLISIIVGLWSMLFLLPGVYFFYSYLLAPYVLLDHPEMSVFRAMKTSAQISRGYKRQLLMLDLSFIGWLLLSFVVTNIGYDIGLLFNSEAVGNVFSTLLYTVVAVFVMPYRELSLVNFYDAIRPQDLNVDQK